MTPIPMPIPARDTISRELAIMKNVIFRAIRLVFDPAPGLTLILIALTVIQGLLPLAALYVMKLIVDAVTVGITAPDKTSVIPHVTLLLGAAVAIAMLIAICRAVSSYTTEVQSMVLTDVISDRIQAHSIRLDLAYYENPAYHDTLQRAQQDGPARPPRIVTDLVQIGQNSISICAVGGFILTFSPVVGLVLIAATLPAAFVRNRFSRNLYDLRLRQTESERRGWYYHIMMTTLDYAREIRQFDLSPLFRERYRTVRKAIRTAQLAITRSRVIWETVTQGIVTLAIFGSFAVIALMTIRGEISLGDMVMFYMGFQLCIGYIQAIFSSMNALYEDQLFLRNFFEFLDLEPGIRAPADPVPIPTPMKQGIRFEDVSFSYPGSDRAVMDTINFTLHKGEIIALVGENGAGKSTLIKLLCRLYDPGKGRITVDGIDLKRTDPDDWRRHTTVLFQDYVRYHFTARENIWMGNTRLPPGSPHIQEAARMAAADGVIGRLRDTYETPLGKHFTGGQELSSGEWQKIALARAFFRDAELVILDEPASSLDALAESEIFTRFRELVSGRTAVIISHRFSTVLLADHIYVIERGKIIEDGTHAELLAQNGRYAEMFRVQADPYK
jgi:ATP-binding cassette, subfamily B, bacterial